MDIMDLAASRTTYTTSCAVCLTFFHLPVDGTVESVRAASKAAGLHYVDHIGRMCAGCFECHQRGAATNQLLPLNREDWGEHNENRPDDRTSAADDWPIDLPFCGKCHAELVGDEVECPFCGEVFMFDDGE